MIETYDVGSMPFIGDLEKFSEGAVKLISQPLGYYEGASDEAVKYFEMKIAESFLDKLSAGIDIPNYPQFRDMTKMFLEKMEAGYFETGTLSLRNSRPDIPEVLAIRRNSREIYERNGEPFRVKLCVTGPYTLSLYIFYIN